MGEVACTIYKIGAGGGGSTQQKLIKAAKKFGFVEAEFAGGATSSAPGGYDVFGVIYLNKASITGHGGSTLSLNLASSTVTFGT